jgi:translation initiation factor 6 (eIF-6)
MPATPNGDFEAVLAGEINGINHVGSAAAAGNQGWVESAGEKIPH